MTSYRVGQVLYVVLHKETKIYPMQVVEEVTKKTLNGTETTYMVKGGPNMPEAVQIDRVEGEFFDSATKVQRALLERATNGINTFVENAVAKAQEWFPTGFEEANADDMPIPLKPAEAGQIRQARPVPLPVRGKPKRPAGPPPEVAELAAELQADNEKLEVEMPDGTKVRVNSIKVPESMQG